MKFSTAPAPFPFISSILPLNVITKASTLTPESRRDTLPIPLLSKYTFKASVNVVVTEGLLVPVASYLLLNSASIHSFNVSKV